MASVIFRSESLSSRERPDFPKCMTIQIDFFPPSSQEVGEFRVSSWFERDMSNQQEKWQDLVLLNIDETQIKYISIY
jgi:hypothetical protein